MKDQETANLLISKNIRKLRVDNKYTLQKMGEILGVTNQQFSLLELGKTRIFAAQLAILAKHFNINVEYFYKNNK